MTNTGSGTSQKSAVPAEKPELPIPALKAEAIKMVFYRPSCKK